MDAKWATIRDAVPQALRGILIWLTFNLERVAGREKPGKIPYQGHGDQRSSITKVADRATIERALETAEQYNRSGVGFVLSDELGIVVIDLDNCVLPDGSLQSWAETEVRNYDSYAEISPSGLGVHILVRGSWTAGWCRKERFEVYARSRYITFSGRRLTFAPAEIMSRQVQLDELAARYSETRSIAAEPTSEASGFAGSDDDLVHRARSAKNGTAFAAFFDGGDLGAYDGDASRADLALCGNLAFWCGRDEARIDRLFRCSALMRPKWDELRGAQTYGALTIRKALEGRTDFYTEREDNEETKENQHADAVAQQANKSRDQLLLSIAKDWRLFAGSDGEPYASLVVGDHRETRRLSSHVLRYLLADAYHRMTGHVCPAQPILDVLGFLAGRAIHGGVHEEVFVRVGRANTKIYLDLGSPSFSVVEIDALGWRVLPASPLNFRRMKGMLPLPEPQRGGSLQDLKALLNLRDESQFILLVGWLVATLRGRGPYPLLLLVGEQGTAKTTTASCLKRLIDPSTAVSTSAPDSERDLAVTASAAHVLSYDNLSFVPDWLSDCLCRLSTGEGFATRKLYSDDEPMIFSLARPVMLTGIEDLARRGDLLDRLIQVRLEPIPESARRTSSELEDQFTALQPKLLGALLDAVASALANEERTVIERLPRMADVARWVTAAEPALPWTGGKFLEAYARNRELASEVTLESDLLAGVVLELLDQEDFTGTPTKLLDKLRRLVDTDTTRSKQWPKTVSAMSGRLSRLAPALRGRGLEIETGRLHTGRFITLRKLDREASLPSPRHQRLARLASS